VFDPGRLRRTSGGGKFIAPEQQARLSMHRPFFTRSRTGKEALKQLLDKLIPNIWPAA
jgi:hypothetical protein